MAREERLKVFRTPARFHDAYVAAPSQKAALAAWGADSNLFASGSAERVEDVELMREPLASPGKVIRRLRGTLAEHVAALPKTAKGGASKAARALAARPEEAAGEGARPAQPAKPRPLPSRAPVERAEAALAALEQRQADAVAEVARRQAELERTRRALEARQDRERAKLSDRLAVAREKYDRAMRAWREA